MEQNPMNPVTWNKEQWKDAIIGVAVTVLALVEVFTFILFTI